MHLVCTLLKRFFCCQNFSLDGSNRVLVETNGEASKTLYLKAFQSLKICLDWSTVTKARFALSRDNCTQIDTIERQTSPRGNFSPVTLRCLFWPIGKSNFCQNLRLRIFKIQSLNKMQFSIPPNKGLHPSLLPFLTPPLQSPYKYAEKSLKPRTKRAIFAKTAVCS